MDVSVIFVFAPGQMNVAGLGLHERLIATMLDEEEARGLEPGFRRDIERRVKDVRARKAKGVDALRALRKM